MGLNTRARKRARRVATVASVLALAGPGLYAACSAGDGPAPAPPAEDAGVPRRGGRLTASLRSEPTTFNPLVAADLPSQAVLQLLMADLVHIDRATADAEPALAESWTVSADGRRYSVRLRPGLRFSDGTPLAVEDVVFSFRAYLDEAVASPQRPLLLVGGEPIAVRAAGPDTVEFELAAPYAAAERLFDGFAVLPRRRLEGALAAGRLREAWGIATDPAEVVGLGPFRLRRYQPGEHLILERNPHYWERGSDGQSLPYLEEIAFVIAGSEQAELIRFEAGQIDVLSGSTAEAFDSLARADAGGRWRLVDLGPGLEQHFLFFNLNRVPGEAAVARRQAWFRNPAFRRAVSAAVDREALVRLVYRGRAAPLWVPVPPGNTRWVNREIPRPGRSLERARALLAEAGFAWDAGGELVDGAGRRVEFSLVTNAGNRPREEMAAILHHDLEQLGMSVQIATLEFRALLDRLFRTFDYDACILGMVSPDADPNTEIDLWSSGGGRHLWQLAPAGEPPPWQLEIDRLMSDQLTRTSFEERRRMYDRVQVLLAEHSPVVPLVSPHILVAADARLGNFRPGLLPPYALWNAAELYWTAPPE